MGCAKVKQNIFLVHESRVLRYHPPLCQPRVDTVCLLVFIAGEPPFCFSLRKRGRVRCSMCSTRHSVCATFNGLKSWSQYYIVRLSVVASSCCMERVRANLRKYYRRKFMKISQMGRSMYINTFRKKAVIIAQAFDSRCCREVFF